MHCRNADPVVLYDADPGFSVALPMDSMYRDGSVGMYHFRYLRSTHELRNCGRLIDNPLLGLMTEGKTVMITRGCREVLGIAQILENQVIHVEGIRNAPMTGEPRKAFETWCTDSGLRLPEDEAEGEYWF